MSDLIPLHLTWLRAGGRSERTIEDRRRLLAHADRCLPYGIDEAASQEWAQYLANPRWQPWTRCIYDRHARGYYSWAVPTYLTFNPMNALIRPPEGDRIPDPATDEELALALSVLPEQPWRMAVRLAAYGGLRCAELVSLRREDCNASWLRVRRKGGKLATVAMAPPLWAAIEHQPPGPLVTKSGRPVGAKALSQAQCYVWRRIGQPHQHLHRFRAWFATTMLANGVDIRTVQDLLGHACVTSTQIYTAVTDVRRLAAVSVLPALIGAPASP